MAMPQKYLAIKQAFLKRHLPMQQAEQSAAKIYNSERKPGQKPVTNQPEQPEVSRLVRSPKHLVPHPAPT
jgi:hypothetical protein